MSAHTKDVQRDGRCSLTVMAADFQGAAQGRVVLVGSVSQVADGDALRKAVLREKYLAKHKDAYWIDFGYACLCVCVCLCVCQLAIYTYCMFVYLL